MIKVCEFKFIYDSEGCLKFWNCLKNINKVSICMVRLFWIVWILGKYCLNFSFWVFWIELFVLVYLKVNLMMDIVVNIMYNYIFLK